MAALILTPGCSSFLGGDDDCEFGGVPAPEGEPGLAAIEERRDPFTGQCQEVIPPGGGDPCGTLDTGGDRAPEIPRGLCYQLGCEGLAEAECFARSDCRAAYIDDGADLAYYDCWSTPDADVSIADPADCAVQDAIACSRYNNCSAVHEPDCQLADGCTDPDVGSFVACMAEGPVSAQ